MSTIEWPKIQSFEEIKAEFKILISIHVEDGVYDNQYIVYYNEDRNVIDSGWLSKNKVCRFPISFSMDRKSALHFTKEKYNEIINLLSVEIKKKIINKQKDLLNQDFV